MKKFQVEALSGFDVLAGTSLSQAATMVLDPGQSTGGADNEHPDSDQWLYVLSGSGSATVAGEEVDLSQGTLLLVQAGESHEIRNTGEDPLRTLDFYAPPAF